MIRSLIVFLIFSISTFASSTYIAIKFNGKIFLNSDVRKFIINTKLTDGKKIELFTKANKNFNEYQNLVNQWADSKMDQGIKQMSYFIMLQDHALSRRGKENGQRVAFNVSESEYFNAIQESESQTLKHLLDQKKGIVKSREIFGQFLIDQNYPHEQSDSPTDVYFRWYDSLKERLKEEFRIREVQKYERHWAIKNNGGQLRPRLTAPWDFKERVDQLALDLLQDKNLNQSQVTNILNQKDELGVRIKEVKVLGLHHTKLNELEEDTVVSAIKELSNNLENKIDDLIRYESISRDMKEKYKTTEELQKKADEAFEVYMNNSDYNALMLARIHRLAMHDSSNRDAILDLIKNNYSLLVEKIIMTIKEENSLTFEQAVQFAAQESLKNILNHDDSYSQYLTEMISWVFKFEAKKISFNYPNRTEVEFYEYKSIEGHQRITNYLKLKLYQDGLKKFRTRELNRYDYSFELRLPDNRIFFNNQAFDFIING